MQFSPSKEERKKIEKVASDIYNKIKIKDATPILGGSGAKDTWLPGSKELDIFVKFNYHKYKEKSNKLSDILQPVLKRKFKKIARLHGSRDYFRIQYAGFNRSSLSLNTIFIFPGLIFLRQ